MSDIYRIINDHKVRKGNVDKDGDPKNQNHEEASYCEIPNIFFDDVLVNHKFSRPEFLVLMYLYRQVWCRPNLYKIHGVSSLISHTELSNALKISLDDIYQSLRKLEDQGFITVFRTGQYFVRKYFTKKLDETFLQTYDDFEF